MCYTTSPQRWPALPAAEQGLLGVKTPPLFNGQRLGNRGGSPCSRCVLLLEAAGGRPVRGAGGAPLEEETLLQALPLGLSVVFHSP